MVQNLISNSPTARWFVLAMISVTMLCGYFITDVMAPLETLLENPVAQGGMGWTASDYGYFSSAYGWFNVFLFMLIIGGIILDKMGMRFTGTMAVTIMIIGVAIKYWAVAYNPQGIFTFFGAQVGAQVFYAAVGFAIFGVGVEIAGITATKIIAKWFAGKELAFAMALQVACARIGTGIALGFSAMIAKKYMSLSLPILLGLALLCIGLISFLAFSVMDRKLDKQLNASKEQDEDEKFRMADIWSIAKLKGFWYIAILCVLFYSAVFPFLKYASGLMVNKFGVDPEFAGLIPAILPFGTILLTPLFGNILDHKGKGANIMILGSAMIVAIHATFAIPSLSSWFVAIVLMVLLGIAFSLVPAAMWPAVTKIVPMHKLGTAYALIFWIQNWGLMGVPYLIGIVLEKYCIIGYATNTESIAAQGAEVVEQSARAVYDYTLPMLIFAGFGTLAIIFALLLRREDAKKGYGLQLPNIKK